MTASRWIWMLAPALWLPVPLAGQAPGAQLLGRIGPVLADRESGLIEIRRDLHRNPELSGAEDRTAGVIATHLRALGFEVRPRVGGHGVVGLLRGGRPGPLVAYRADMDAVMSNEPDPVPFRSLTPGVRHICGHDIHVTVALAIAEGLAAVQRDLPGAVMLIFQPAEERAAGARAMLADGVFSRLRPDAIYAVHTAPLAVGRLGTRPGRLMVAREVGGVTMVAGVVNDSSLVTRANQAIRAVMGDSAVAEVGMAPSQFSEDFGSFQEQVPGVMWFLGVGEAGLPHSPGYVADEAAILVGARAMLAVILERLARG